MNRARVLCLSLLAAAAIAVPRPAEAKREIGLGFSYDPRIPVGSMRDVVPHAALSAFQGRWEYYVLDNLTLGFAAQYQLFERGAETETLDIANGAVTAPFSRYAYFLSILPTVRYFPWASGPLRPFAEMGVGVTSATASVSTSDVARRSDEGGLMIQPSLGLLWRLGGDNPRVTKSATGPNGELSVSQLYAPRRRESMFAIATSFAWAFTTVDLLGSSNVGYAGIQIGIYTKL